MPFFDVISHILSGRIVLKEHNYLDNISKEFLMYLLPDLSIITNPGTNMRARV